MKLHCKLSTPMKKYILFILLSFTLTSCDEILDVLASASSATSGISQSEASSGLKQALELGVNSGTSFLGKSDGFLKNEAYKILLPQEVQSAVSKIKENPITNRLANPYIDKLITSMNRGAENAMVEAKPIFVNAIKSMSISDAISIVAGGDGAATKYLQRTTSSQLKEKFYPVIKKSLEQVKVNEPWTKLSSAYNTVTGKQVQTDLNEYVTGKAMSALFTQIKIEEDKIRSNPASRTTDLLKKVFAYADGQK